jgi:hypothetical protein
MATSISGRAVTDEIVPATRNKATLEEQAEIVRKMASRCALSDGSCSSETLIFINGEEANVLTFAALTLESLIPVKEQVRRVVWNEQEQHRRGRKR